VGVTQPARGLAALQPAVYELCGLEHLAQGGGQFKTGGTIRYRQGMACHLSWIKDIHVNVNVNQIGELGKPPHLPVQILREIPNIFHGDPFDLGTVDQFLLEGICIADSGEHDVARGRRGAGKLIGSPPALRKLVGDL